jgi:hypothetical protein
LISARSISVILLDFGLKGKILPRFSLLVQPKRDTI